jgi:hypothetical protein
MTLIEEATTIGYFAGLAVSALIYLLVKTFP